MTDTIEAVALQALIVGAGELEQECFNYGNALASTCGDAPWEQVARDAAAHILQAAATISALRAENEQLLRIHDGLQDVAQGLREEGVRAGIEAAASAALQFTADAQQTLRTVKPKGAAWVAVKGNVAGGTAIMKAIRALDVAAIAKGV